MNKPMIILASAIMIASACKSKKTATAEVPTETTTTETVKKEEALQRLFLLKFLNIYCSLAESFYHLRLSILI